MDIKLLASVTLFTAAQLHVQAQGYAELDINNIRARFNADGMIGFDGSSSTVFEVPNGDGTHALFAAHLWMGGYSPDEQLKLAAEQYGQVGQDWWPGPLTNDGVAFIDAATSALYDQVWKLNAADVALHQAYCGCLQDPNCDEAVQFPGYQAPAYFNTWPAIGDMSAGQDQYLAPFLDYNGDGDYNPGDCDMPCGPGDQSLYFIFNDRLDVHTESGGQPIGVEVQTRPFAYNGPTAALVNTVFVEYRVINRGTQTMDDFHVGLFTDYDLGCPGDDYMGCDVGRSMWYAFNGALDDAGAACPGGVQGYGVQPPAFGATILCGLFNDADGTDWTADSALVAFNGQGTGDAIIDNERQGLMHFGRMDPGVGPTGDPSVAIQYHNYMKGLWADGSPWLYGGNGHFSHPDADSIQTRFMYPDISDPQGLGTGGVPQAPWSEISAGNAPNDRRSIGSMGPITLEPGEVQRIIVAFVYARGTGGPWSSVAALQDRVDSIIDFASAQNFCGGMNEALSCLNGATDVSDVLGSPTETIAVYPDPASDLLNVVLPQALDRAALRVVDALGRTVLSLPKGQGAARRLDLSQLVNGHYVLIAEQAGTRSYARFIKE